MNKDKFCEVLKILITAIVLLLIVGFIPNMNIQYKHFNILSDIFKSETSEECVEETPGESALQEELAAVEATKDSLDQVEKTGQMKQLDEEVQGMVITDYSEKGTTLLPLFQAMQKCRKDNRRVRIGVLGDSFIEADIMTSKLRTLLQTEYGGMGVGFVPVASPAAQYRKTVHHSFTGWITHSMVYYKKADWKRFCLSGYYFIPSEGASVSLKTVKEETVSRVSFFFINQKRTKIDVSINEGPFKTYEPSPSEDLQQLTFSENSIQSVTIKLNGVDGFTAFGAYMDNPFGVYVDNYSVRGSSGSVLITMNKELTEQLKKDVSYDLLIVQYGLNVISNKSYAGYRKLMKDAVNHLKECYPGVPILLMSIGDKGAKGSDGVTTHPGVIPLIQSQRQIAQETGVCFWNTYEAMGGEKSIINFVNHKPPLAAKDYTHINIAGGDVIGERLYEALMLERKRLLP